MNRREMLKTLGLGSVVLGTAPLTNLLSTVEKDVGNLDFVFAMTPAGGVTVSNSIGQYLGSFSGAALNFGNLTSLSSTSEQIDRNRALQEAGSSLARQLPSGLAALSSNILANFKNEPLTLNMAVRESAALRNPTQDAVYVGQYVISGGYDYTGYVGGCIRRNTAHLGFRIHRNGQQLVNFHFAGWWQNGRACFGIYESQRNLINWCFCPQDLLNSLYQALVNALSGLRIGNTTISRSTALTLAAVIAVSVFVLLVAIPAVPPPP